MGTYTKAQLTEQLERIQAATDACRNAIITMGVNVPNDAKLADLATYAALIQCSHPDIPCYYIGNSDIPLSTRKNVYFDTGLYGGSNITFDAVFSKSVAYNDGMLFGADDSTSTSFFFIPLYSKSYKYWFCNRIAGRNTLTSGSSSGLEDTFIHYSSNTNLEGSDVYGIVMNGVHDTYNTINSSSKHTSNTIYLFARNKGASGVDCKSPSGSKLRYISFYDNGNLVRFYIPVLHYVNDTYTPCLYDMVNKTYNYNLGTDTPSYSAMNAYLLTDIHYTSNKTDMTLGFATNYNSDYYMRFDAAYTTSTESIADNSSKMLLGNRVSSSIVYGLYSSVYSSGQKAAVLYPSSKSILSSTISANTRYTLSAYIGYGDAALILNNTKTTGYNSPSSSGYGLQMYILGNGTVYANTKLEYGVISDRYRINSLHAIPIIDNSTNTVSFYDLDAQTSYTYNGDSSQLGYDLLV